MIWIALAAGGLGFAGYVFLAPYQKMKSALTTIVGERDAQRSAVEAAEAERDKLKADVATYAAAAQEQEAKQAKGKGEVEALTAELAALKSTLDGVGARTVAGDGRVAVIFPAFKMIDRNGIDVSEGGASVLQALAGAIKKAGARVTITARVSSAPPPRTLKSLFRSAGEMYAVRAARVMSAFESAGLAPSQVSIVGAGPLPAEKPARGRGRRAVAAPPAERLEIEVEPG